MLDVHVTRHDLSTPDQYRIDLNESILMELEEGVYARIASLEASVAEHISKCQMGVRCVVQQERNASLASKQMIETGSLSPTSYLLDEISWDCSEDMMFLHGQLHQLYAFTFQAQYLRNRPNEEKAL